MEGTRPLTGPALPNLINAVSMFKVKNRIGFRRDKQVGFRRDKQVDVDVDFDFKILTAFIRLGRAGPVGAGCPPILYGFRLGRAGPVGAGCPP